MEDYWKPDDEKIDPNHQLTSPTSIRSVIDSLRSSPTSSSYSFPPGGLGWESESSSEDLVQNPKRHKTLKKQDIDVATLQLFLFVTATKQTWTIEVPSTGSVQDIFRAVLEKRDIPMDQQRISTRNLSKTYWGEREKENDFVLLSDVGIKNESTLLFCLRC